MNRKIYNGRKVNAISCQKVFQNFGKI